MKKIRLFSVLAAFVAALSFTSCNTDSDSVTSLTVEQQNNYQAAMALGSYSDMKLHYEHKNADDVKQTTDSVDTYCTVSMYKDSTITMANFPVAALAEHINKTELAEAIAKESPRTIKIKYCVLPTSTTSVAYLAACPEVQTLNLTYGGETHKVQLVFSYNAYYSNGYCTLTGTKKLGLQFYLYQIWVDGKQTDYIKNSVTSNSYVAFFCQPKYSKQ